LGVLKNVIPSQTNVTKFSNLENHC